MQLIPSCHHFFPYFTNITSQTTGLSQGQQKGFRPQNNWSKTGAKPKSTTECWSCGKLGHLANECYSKRNNQKKKVPSVKSCDVRSQDSDQKQQEQQLNSLKVVSQVSSTNGCGGVAERHIEAFATQVQTPLVTNSAMMTRV